MSILRITGTLERYEITFPEQRLMAAAKGLILLQAQDLSKVFGEFADLARPFLPIDVPEDDPIAKYQSEIEPPRPKDEDFLAMEELASRYVYECTLALGYLIDLRHVFQNNLLGHLFKRTLAARMPNKSDLLVITNDEVTLSKIECRIKEYRDELHNRAKEWRESS